MLRSGPVLAMLTVAVLAGGKAATAESVRFRYTSHATKDSRVLVDRVHAINNRHRQDYSFLNAVGAVWPADIPASAAGYMAATGFVIDRCHVLTNLHAVYIDDLVLHPALGKQVYFAVGQTEGNANSGALQGLKYLLTGNVVAHGDAVILDHVVHDPENDWALIRLAANVQADVRPMTIASVDRAQLLRSPQISLAGFPADRRATHGDRLDLKDLWESGGTAVRVVWGSSAGAFIESTIQATRGNSGGPVYGDFDGQTHVVIGMHEGATGNGFDVSEKSPNIHLLFTEAILTIVLAEQTQTPCP